MRTLEVLNVLRRLAPEEIALKDDPVGLLIGDEDRGEIHKVGVCLDATPAVATRAAALGAQLLVAHHPLIYRPLKTIRPGGDPIALAVATLIKADVAFYAMHTNWDRAELGINDTLAGLLQLKNVRPLGTGDLTALPRIGALASPMPLTEFIRFVGDTLGCSGTSALRVNAIPGDHIVSCVAVCGGAGAELAPDAIAAGADAYVTSDVRHHEFIDATGRGLALIDAGHGATEAPGMQALAEMLKGLLPDVEVVWLEG